MTEHGRARESLELVGRVAWSLSPVPPAWTGVSDELALSEDVFSRTGLARATEVVKRGA